MQACEGAGASGGFVPTAPGPLAQGVISAARDTQRSGEQEEGRRKSAPDEACDLQLPLPATGESAGPAGHVSTGSTDQQLDTAPEGAHLITQSVLQVCWRQSSRICHTPCLWAAVAPTARSS